MMNQVLEVDEDERVAWVQPGVLNLDLSRTVRHLGLHFAPDPSSQQSCSVGGNVANNSGGPHCLLYGVTSAHVLALEVVLPDGSVALLGGLDADPTGYDLRGAFVGSEGTMGIATRIAVRLTPLPPAVKTMLIDFTSVDDAAATVSGIISAGIVPAALEMMDARITQAVEAFVHAGFPEDADAVLLVEVDGLPGGVEEEAAAISAIARDHGARTVRVAADDTERALLWKGRKSAFGAIARIKPNYYLHDAVVPRTKLVEVLRQVYDIAARHDLIVMNVFHAGDGNLHPLLVFDKREPGVLERVMAAGSDIVHACIDAGGVLSASDWRSATTCRSSSGRTTSMPRPGCGTPSTPNTPATPRRCCRPGPAAAISNRCRRAPGSRWPSWRSSPRRSATLGRSCASAAERSGTSAVRPIRALGRSLRRPAWSPSNRPR